jgi:hypothetical protein
MEVKNGNCQEKELEADARNALLAHYSSKSTNETAVLIGLAVVIFADFQAYSAFNFPQTWEKITFLIFTLEIIIFFIIRQVSKLITWGQFADAIVCVKMPSVEEAKIELEKKRVKPVHISLGSTYLGRLSVGCGLRFHDCYEQNKESSQSYWDSVPLRIVEIATHPHFAEAFIAVLAISLIVGYIFSSIF